MATVRLDLAYHGGDFAGWAAQPGLRTVEHELSDALGKLLGERVRLSVAGRTDAGVHALAQVASFQFSAAPRPELGRALNGLTGSDLVVRAAGAVEDGFDARRDAKSRTYVYRIDASPLPNPFERGLSLWWPHRLERAALDACAAALRGRHDFTAFTPTETRHTRFERDILRATWIYDPPNADAGARPAPSMVSAGRGRAEQLGGICEFWIEADSFLRNMIRVLVGTMLEVAGRRREIADFERLLEGGPREGAGDTAQPHGLYLAGVRY